MTVEVHMRPWVAVAVTAVAIAALASPSLAQSLAEVAARTKKKDEGKAKPAKVYTETDLRKPSSSGSMSAMEGPADTEASPAAAPTAGTGTAPAGEKPKTEDELNAEKQEEWRQRLQHAQSEVARITTEVDRAQTSLNDLTGPLYGGNRAGLINRLEEGQRQLALAKQQVADLEEEGRRARYR
jgi:hypothetical protein